MTNNEYNWVGNAKVENFSITKSQLENARESRRDWAENIDSVSVEDDSFNRLQFGLNISDTKKNSEASDDHNILHHDSEALEEFKDVYSSVIGREIEQDDETDIVIGQGMSYIDVITEEGFLEAPLKSIEGSWSEIVMAPEEGRLYDKILMEEDASSNYNAELLPGGNIDKAKDAATIETEYTDNPEDFHPEHNIYMTLLMDQAVGRSFETSEDIRNGELLLNNQITAKKPIDWENVEEVVYRSPENGEQFEEAKLGIRGTWEIDILYEDGSEDGKALTYEENSMYLDGFEELDSVEAAYEDQTEMENDLLEENLEESESEYSDQGEVESIELENPNPVKGPLAVTPQGAMINFTANYLNRRAERYNNAD